MTCPLCDESCDNCNTLADRLEAAGSQHEQRLVLTWARNTVTGCTSAEQAQALIDAQPGRRSPGAAARAPQPG